MVARLAGQAASDDGGKSTRRNGGSAVMLQRLEPFLDSLAEPIICTDTDGRILYGNPVAAAAWSLAPGRAPRVLAVDGEHITAELNTHAGSVESVRFAVTDVPDVDGLRSIRVCRASASGDDVVGELRQAAALIAARLGSLDDSGATERPIDPASAEQVERLSEREREILDLILDGNRVSTVASLLFLSENTVRNYLKRIYQKLDVHSLGELRERLAPRAVYRPA